MQDRRQLLGLAEAEGYEMTRDEAEAYIAEMADYELDDETLLKTTSILLKVLKYSVFTATGHRDALDIFRSHAPNLACVVMDANLGETDAVRLLGSFRAIAPGVPVIISSGYAPERIQAQFVTQPYNAFLAKPYTLAELQEAIESLHA